MLIDLLCSGIDINSPEVLNKVLELLFNAKIAITKKYDTNDSDVCFPKYKNNYVEEVLMHYSENQFIFSNAGEYASSSDNSLFLFGRLMLGGALKDKTEDQKKITISQVLMSNNFRLMR